MTRATPASGVRAGFSRRAPERMHLLRGAPDTVANLRARFEQGHEAQNSDAAREFADFVARQAVVVLDLAERRLQGSRYKGAAPGGGQPAGQPRLQRGAGQAG
ncbi:MAG: hypothetical protein IPG06_20895 [Haliea sp.]|nr:hypothetical protein [Haliea sp.]